MKRFKKNKNDAGISLLEVVFALGVMASLTPLVVKFAFKDLSDIKYLNLAKKIKTLTKSIVAYSSKTSGSWQNDSNGTITVENLDSLHLGENVVDKQILDNSYIKYFKSANGEVNVYAVIDMNNYSLTPDKFKQTLLYVENNIGYVIDDACGNCKQDTQYPCVCSINNDWDIEYNKISSKNIQKIGNKFFAVVKVDDNLLKKDYLKDFYLYRNSQGGDSGNVMQRDLSLGGFDLKDIVTIFTQSLFGKNTATELINFKVVEGKFFNNVNVETSLVFAKDLVMNLTGSIIEAANIYFQQPVIFQKFSAPSAILIKDEKSLKNQTITAKNVVFDSASNYMQLDNITVNEVKGMDRTEINGDFAVIDAPHIQMEASSTLKTKIFNVNNRLKIGEGSKVVIDAVSGQIQMDVGSLIINNIKGSSNKVDYVDKIKTTKTLFDNLKTEIQTKFGP